MIMIRGGGVHHPWEKLKCPGKHILKLYYWITGDMLATLEMIFWKE